MRTAIVLVRSEWIRSGVHNLIGSSPSTSNATHGHLVIFPFEHEDEHGVWLADIETSRLTTDGSAVTMKRFLVPWIFIYAFGVVEGAVQKKKVGYLPE